MTVEPALERYAAMLLEWNPRVNLTAARTLAEVREHIDDAGSLLSVDWSQRTSVIDIGSGGGLPAIPLALRLDQVRFTLVEANARKAAFLQHAAGALGLKNVQVAVARAEALARDPTLRERFDRAISRAAARPVVLLELALPFVRVGGDLVAEVGVVQIGSITRAAETLGGGPAHLLAVPGRRGALLIVPKVRPTPAAYPRRPGIPGRRPMEERLLE